MDVSVSAAHNLDDRVVGTEYRRCEDDEGSGRGNLESSDLTSFAAAFDSASIK